VGLLGNIWGHNGALWGVGARVWVGGVGFEGCFMYTYGGVEEPRHEGTDAGGRIDGAFGLVFPARGGGVGGGNIWVMGVAIVYTLC
jgi:hypothetical protein